jgi:hypothetical protein
MESNYNNFNAEKKTVLMNQGFQQTNMQRHPSPHNQVRSMSSNSSAQWVSTAQQWQGNHPQTMQMNANTGYAVPQIRPPTQQYPNNSTARLLAPQNINTVHNMHRSPTRPGPSWPSSPPRAALPNFNTMMTSSPGSPSRTAPPSWPSSSSARPTSAFVVQPPPASINNTPYLPGQQVYLIFNVT